MIKIKLVGPSYKTNIQSTTILACKWLNPDSTSHYYVAHIWYANITKLYYFSRQKECFISPGVHNYAAHMQHVVIPVYYCFSPHKGLVLFIGSWHFVIDLHSFNISATNYGRCGILVISLSLSYSCVILIKSSMAMDFGDEVATTRQRNTNRWGVA